MAITKKDVEHVAKLARLGLSEEEIELFTRQLSAILDFAGSLQKLDTKNILPTSHAIPMKNVLREDKVVTCQNTEDILANAPAEEDHMFRVPRIIE
ncbi:asparaginyl/glutamyl-tRNA amidotransferase subunit C [candidate division WOR-1 bacterium RIFCSPLOWO2_02_FULL_46_20]|uniref:Aspartyl/glutamyl-tRNA(Asn/Gln) amidotransferase subunit C n=2 Tax=Saganbacteria TaxID=1703751 RepID=A0A1F4R8D3_UNCSA|nr:MAG: asparaginyl/glutamyl-tRNA amidotransferase subunit C [candidate division WOR-1 bacterium RIFCSPHIGHO2_02_FULL_45_12]OGC04462.1 MAG: asparaginyl/glutamyl-tRNA amidotransferase subunit C [candidate division WOR-1 bacterium RIFCSPLOWO2_02_FULL_46_20]OGC09614.1 MAG: asparaginyl/glutamyl-tRNA amidotransferase subunit C [candidate division WOR-1 bacterium RIFCSPLOWO2_12_FULL_45_9]